MHSDLISKASVITFSALLLSACNLEAVDALDASAQSEADNNRPESDSQVSSEQPAVQEQIPNSDTPSAPVDEPISVEEPSVVVEVPGNPAFVFQVIDSNDAFITEIASGDVIDVSTLPEFFNIEAVPMEEQFDSVSFEASGSGYSLSRVEESPIWTVSTSTEGFKAGEGTYVVAATGYSEDRTEGTASETMYITFTLMSGSSISEPGPIVDTPVVIEDTTTTAFDITWQKPVEYSNGESLSSSDIAGYEILYRVDDSISFTRVYVEGADSLATEVAVEGSGDFEFSIATVGVDGFYSVFSEPEMVNL